MSKPKKPPAGHREAPVRVQLDSPYRVAVPGAESVWEPQIPSPRATMDDQPLAYDVQIEDDDGEEGVPAVGSPPAPQQALARVTLRFEPRKRPARGVPPETLNPAQPIGFDGTTPVRNRGWTIDDAQPAPVASPPRRKAKVIENPEVPEARRPVRVIVESFGSASEEERRWVTCGDPGVYIVTEGTGRSRLVACYSAALILEHTEDLTGAREVKVRIRWSGISEDREGKWVRKLRQNRDERLNQLLRALEFFLSFPKLRTGVAVQFIGLPLTNPKKAARHQRHGIYFSGREGVPAVMVRVNTVVADAELDEALQFYMDWGVLWPPNHFTGTWPFITSDAWAKHRLGRSVAKGEVKEFGEDGLTQEQRAGLLGGTAAKAAVPMTSMCRVAWDGDLAIETAMAWEGQPPVRPTVLGTVWEDEVE